MKYFSKVVNLKCINLIVDFVFNDITRQLGNKEIMRKIHNVQDITQIRLNHELPTNTLKILNEELLDNHIGPLWYSQSYIRTKNTSQPIHIDGNPITGLIHAAINIPIKGSKNSNHNFYKGIYKLDWVKKKDNSYYEIKWEKNPLIDQRLELLDPCIVRTDIPHNVDASVEEDRWAFTMRFKGNPSFDKLTTAFGE